MVEVSIGVLHFFALVCAFFAGVSLTKGIEYESAGLFVTGLGFALGTMIFSAMAFGY